MDVPRLLHVKRQRYDDVLQIGLGRRREVDGVLLRWGHAYSHVERVLHRTSVSV